MTRTGVSDPGYSSLIAVFSLLLVLLLAGCATTPPPSALVAPPPAPREFRGVWVATVKNLDWPSQPGLSAEQQRTEMRTILDRVHALHLNAVILQVRPSADAIYPSALEPWSEYLTGVQGRDPGYDPLAEWVTEAHRRGLELHAWFNPYRARHNEAKSPPAPNHLSKTHPEAVKSYGDMLWMDPGEPAAVQQTLAVVADVVRRYDIDGVHIDDYFYPYPVTKPLPANAPKDAVAEAVDFPDEPSWLRYQAGGGKLSRADWRRQHVDQLVEQLSRVIHATKPWVKFGVSPFGLGRPDRRPAGITGFSQYDKLYANVELWLEHGWVDYLVPQLYWPRAQTGQEFAPLLDYWLAQNPAGRHVWPGLYASAINDTPKGWKPEEIMAEVALARARPAVGGQVLFSSVALVQDRRGIATRLQAETYIQPALVPAFPWLGGTPPAAPRFVADRTGLTVRAGDDRPVAVFAVWIHHDGYWEFSVLPAEPDHPVLAPGAPAGTADEIVVSAVDRAGNEGPRATWTPAAVR